MTWRTFLWLACIATEAGALVAAVWNSVHAERKPETSRATPRHQALLAKLRNFAICPLIVLLACALAIDLTLGFTDPLDRSAWSYGLNAFAASGPRPRTPLVRLAYHLADGLAMAWPLAVAWASGRVFAAPETVTSGGGLALGRGGSEGIGVAGHKTSGRSSGAPTVIKSAPMSDRPLRMIDVLAGVYLGAVIGIAGVYPLPAGATRWLLWAWEAVCVAAAWAGVARGWPGRGGAVETAAIVLVACETMVCTCGPFLSDPFTRWWIATAFYLVAFAGVGVVLGRARRPGVS